MGSICWKASRCIHGRARQGEGACAANKDETWLHVYDYGNITYQAVGVMKAVRFAFFLVRARTNMDPNKWVIFPYDRVPTCHVLAILPTPQVQSLCFPILLSTSWNMYKNCLKAMIKADISHPEIYGSNEAKVLGIPPGEFEHNNCSAWSSEQKYRHCDRS